MSAQQELAPPVDKARATLFAALAIAGHAVHKTTAGGFLVTRWNMTRHCADLQELEAFARQIGAIR